MFENKPVNKKNMHLRNTIYLKSNTLSSLKLLIIIVAYICVIPFYIQHNRYTNLD